MKDNGRQLKSMEYAAFDPGSGYLEHLVSLRFTRCFVFTGVLNR